MPLTGDPQKQAVAIALKEQRGDQEGPLPEQFPEVPPPRADDAPIAPQAGPAGRAAGILFLTPDRRALLMHRGDGGDFPRTWGFPGGHQVEGEDLEQCARREALEETGLNYEGELTELHDNGQFRTYLARVPEAFPVELCDESTGYTWTSLDALPEPMHPGIAVTLRVLNADTELAWAQLMRDGILPSPQVFERSGAAVFLIALRITGTGTSYRSKLNEHVYRDAELYLNDEFLARCNGLPVIVEHPVRKVLNADEFSKRICGMVTLPYLQGDEVWGIARIYSTEAITWIRAALQDGKPISTSPGVVFDGDSGNVKVTLEHGGKLLIEGKPAILDHLAICELGVWDKGGPPAGVELTAKPNEELAMADDDKVSKADADKMVADALKRRDDDDAKRKADDDAKHADAVSKAVADAMKRRDDDDAKKKADDDAKRKADEEEAARKAADDDAKACDSAALADAQSRADSVLSMLGEQAPRPLAGETVMAYRRRILNKLKPHSTKLKDADLTKLDSVGLGLAEDQIFADAAAFARSPRSVGAGELRPRTVVGEAGHRITTYDGDMFGWLGRHVMEPRRVTITPAQDLRR